VKLSLAQGLNLVVQALLIPKSRPTLMITPLTAILEHLWAQTLEAKAAVHGKFF
jgi:hypothetical protein